MGKLELGIGCVVLGLAVGVPFGCGMATKPPPPTPRTTLMSEFIHKCVDDLANRDGCLPPGEDLVRACTDAADLIYGGQ